MVIQSCLNSLYSRVSRDSALSRSYTAWLPAVWNPPSTKLWNLTFRQPSMIHFYWSTKRKRSFCINIWSFPQTDTAITKCLSCHAGFMLRIHDSHLAFSVVHRVFCRSWVHFNPTIPKNILSFRSYFHLPHHSLVNLLTKSSEETSLTNVRLGRPSSGTDISCLALMATTNVYTMFTSDTVLSFLGSNTANGEACLLNYLSSMDI